MVFWWLVKDSALGPILGDHRIYIGHLDAQETYKMGQLWGVLWLGIGAIWGDTQSTAHPSRQL